MFWWWSDFLGTFISSALILLFPCDKSWLWFVGDNKVIDLVVTSNSCYVSLFSDILFASKSLFIVFSRFSVDFIMSSDSILRNVPSAFYSFFVVTKSLLSTFSVVLIVSSNSLLDSRVSAIFCSFFVVSK
jgi:hypothetical protein